MDHPIYLSNLMEESTSIQRDNWQSDMTIAVDWGIKQKKTSSGEKIFKGFFTIYVRSGQRTR